MDFQHWHSAARLSRIEMGADPYNTYDARADILLKSMDAVWRAVCTESNRAPDFIFVEQWVIDWITLRNVTPDHLYGTEHWWYA